MSATPSPKNWSTWFPDGAVQKITNYSRSRVKVLIPFIKDKHEDGSYPPVSIFTKKCSDYLDRILVETERVLDTLRYNGNGGGLLEARKENPKLLSDFTADLRIIALSPSSAIKKGGRPSYYMNDEKEHYISGWIEGEPDMVIVAFEYIKKCVDTLIETGILLGMEPPPLLPGTKWNIAKRFSEHFKLEVGVNGWVTAYISTKFKSNFGSDRDSFHSACKRDFEFIKDSIEDDLRKEGVVDRLHYLNNLHLRISKNDSHIEGEITGLEDYVSLVCSRLIQYIRDAQPKNKETPWNNDVTVRRGSICHHAKKMKRIKNPTLCDWSWVNKPEPTLVEEVAD